MSNYNNITARWDRGTLSEAIISRQFDDAATRVAFAGVPTGDDDEDAVYHLIVWMATEEGGEPHEQAPILLDAPEWLISNFYTQFTQVIRFQLCIQTEGGAYEAHSPIFSGRIARSLRHDGTTDDINTSVLFDPYKKYVDEKAMAAGAVVIDADLDEDSENPVQNKIVAGAITGLNGRLDDALDNIGYTVETSANLLNPEEFEAGRITSASSEILHTGSYDTDYRTTGFIPVESGKKYGFYYISGGNIINFQVANIWAYDTNKSGLSYVGSIAANAEGTTYITAPSNAKYIRASIITPVINTYGLLQISETNGTAPAELVPYYTKRYLSEYVKTDALDKTNAKVNALEATFDACFTDKYEDLTGTVTSSKYIKANGSVADIASELYRILTVSASPNSKYKVTGCAYYNSYYYAFYDSNNAFISGLKATESGTTAVTDLLVTSPDNAVTLVVASDSRNIKAQGVVGKITLASVPWSGKKWAVVGDSITERNEATTKHYFDYIAESSGIETYNMGAGGTGYSRGYDTNRAFYQRISSVPLDSDVVTIFGSGNDTNVEAMAKFSGMTWAEALGTYTDSTTDTLCGCVNVTLDNYFSVMPTVPIGIIAPTPWKTQPTTLLTHNRFADYTNALKQIAEYRGVPFLDLYHKSNLRPENDENCDLCFYGGASLDGNGDGVHPNELGHKIIAPKIYEFVKSLLLD